MDDLIRSRIIRLTDTQRDHIFHRTGQIEKFTDTGKWYRFHIAGKFIVPIH